MASNLSWHDDFRARVQFAADVISRGERTSRRFDSTCENYDGDAVAAALVRRAKNRPETKLAQNLWRYLCRETCEEIAKRLDGLDLDVVAAEMRVRGKQSALQ